MKAFHTSKRMQKHCEFIIMVVHDTCSKVCVCLNHIIALCEKTDFGGSDQMELD